MRRMAKRGRTIKARIVDDARGRHDLQHLYDAYVKYIELSRYLFGSKEPIYDINEMSGDSGFFADAVRCILIGGEMLAKLMIKFNVGVVTRNVFEIKDVDQEYLFTRLTQS